MSEDELPADATETIAEASEVDGGLIIVFVVCILLGLGVLGWHYHSSDKTPPICGTPDAHCGDKIDPVAQ